MIGDDDWGAQKAQDRVEFTQQPVSDSERQRRRTEALLSRMALQLSEGQQKNAADLTDLGARLHDMEGNLPELNHLVRSSQVLKLSPKKNTCSTLGV